MDWVIQPPTVTESGKPLWLRLGVSAIGDSNEDQVRTNHDVHNQDLQDRV